MDVVSHVPVMASARTVTSVPSQPADRFMPAYRFQCRYRLQVPCSPSRSVGRVACATGQSCAELACSKALTLDKGEAADTDAQKTSEECIVTSVTTSYQMSMCMPHSLLCSTGTVRERTGEEHKYELGGDAPQHTCTPAAVISSARLPHSDLCMHGCIGRQSRAHLQQRSIQCNGGARGIAHRHPGDIFVDVLLQVKRTSALIAKILLPAQ